MMKKTSKIIAYYRVSTKRQSLGLDAQRSLVEEYAAANGLTIVEEVEEKESGKECNRPGLNFAMASARKHRAALVVAKHDRLSRDLAFAAEVFFKSGIEVVALNMPENVVKDPLLFAVYYGMAQKERELISQRTKAALKAIKKEIEETGCHISKNGNKIVKFGRGGYSEEIRAKGEKVRRDNANNHPANLAAAAELRKYFDGATKRNLSAAARHLNELQLYTRRGVFHDAKSVKLLIARYSI